MMCRIHNALKRFFCYSSRTMCTALLLMVITLLAASGCSSARMGGAIMGDSAKADYDQPAEEYASDLEVMEKSMRGAAPAPSVMPGSPQSDDNTPVQRPQQRLVIYTGQFGIETDNIENSIKLATEMAKEMGGFVESVQTGGSLRQATVVLRVPVSRFEDALTRVEKFGDVKNRSVSASDVTDQYNDIALRIDTAKKVRARLYELLKRTTDPKVEIKILEEIERLTSEIETLEATINLLKSRADFSTIRISFALKSNEQTSKYLSSPFAWIRALQYNSAPGSHDIDNLEFTDPQDMFAQRRDYQRSNAAFIYSNPGNSVRIRVYRTENYPQADLKFWEEAFTIDMANRLYTVEERNEIKSSVLNFNTWLFKVSADVRYFVAFAIDGDSLVIVEAVCDTPEQYKNYAERIRAFVAGIRSSK